MSLERMSERDRATRTIAADGEHELEVKKSRFQCALARVSNEDGAREFLRQRRARHHEARHHCSAYLLDDGRVQKSSDDGEPSGTAGVPMLEVLRRRELTDTIAVVSRYFGGVLLGAGGLIRAYGSAVSEAIDAVGVVELRQMLVVTTEAEHALAGRLENDLRGAGYPLAEVRYGQQVCLDVHVTEEQLDRFRTWLAEVTGGVARAEITGRTRVEVPVSG